MICDLEHILFCISPSDWNILVVVKYMIILLFISVFKKIICKWFYPILSGLTVRSHCCCQHELLPLDVDRVQPSKAFCTRNKAAGHTIVE
jgi:hypothetical protein